MIKSMTAFAREESHGLWGSLAWELRSVNHRYLDVTLRLPEELRALEPAVREMAAQCLKRGKLDCGLRYQPAQGSGGQLEVNSEYAAQVIAASDEVSLLMQASATPTSLDILAWPGVVSEQQADKELLQSAALDSLQLAFDALIANREREGERLQAMLQQRLDAIGPLVETVKQRMPQILNGVRERLRNKLEEFNDSLDATRIEQEMVLLAQKLDVDEELDRLMSHVAEMSHTLERKEAVGRRLDFLMQEFNREANTLGSKSQNTEVTRVSVELKVLIEQMREQIQNIE